MIDHAECFLDGLDDPHRGRGHTVDHEHLDAEHSGSLDLGIGGAAAAVLGDHRIDLVLLEKSNFAIQHEGPTIENIVDTGQLQERRHRIDASHEIGMPRRRLGEMCFLPSCREEDTAFRSAERSDCFGKARNDRPAIAWLRDPGGTAQRQGLYAGALDSIRSIGRNTRGEGVRGIDKKVEGTVAKKCDEPVGTTESACTRQNRLCGRFLSASGKRQQDVEIIPTAQRFGQRPRFTRPTQYQHADFCHV